MKISEKPPFAAAGFGKWGKLRKVALKLCVENENFSGNVALPRQVSENGKFLRKRCFTDLLVDNGVKKHYNVNGLKGREQNVL